MKKHKLGRPPKQKYVDYVYEQVYDHQIESRIDKDLLLGKIKSIYATKTIKAGNQLEIEIFPEFTKRRLVPSEGLINPTREAQRNLNDKNARKKIVRLVNENFKTGYIVHLTYDKIHLPKNWDDSKKDIQNFFRKINYRLKKKGALRAKYIYVTEHNEEAKIRWHHHIVIDCDIGMDELSKLWKNGKRNEFSPIDYDEDGLTGFATYIAKQKRNKSERRWNTSKGNLRDPVVRKDHQTFRRKHIRRMFDDFNSIKGMVSQKYKGYVYKDAQVFVNQYNAGVYIYVQMRKWDPLIDGRVDDG